MLSFTKNHPFINSYYCIICVLPFVISLPFAPKDDPFDKFIEFLSNNNCSMPKEVDLPFSVVTDSVPFSYLSFPLKECKSSEAVKVNNEANLLCREVFEVIQNITCIDYKLNTSKIESGKLSTDVCQDFAAIQDVIPKQNEFLSSKFGDSIICNVMCAEKYELLCKTLLWGYDTQAKLKNALLEKNLAVEEEENLENHPDSNEIPHEEINSNLDKPKKEPNKSISMSNAVSDVEPKIPNTDKTAESESSTSAIAHKEKEPESHEEKAGMIDTQKTNSENTGKSIKASKGIQPTAEAASKSSNDLSEQNQDIETKENQVIESKENQDIKSEQNPDIKSEQNKNIKNEQNQNIKSGQNENMKNEKNQSIKSGQNENIKSKENQNIPDDKNNDLEENNNEIPSKSSSKKDKIDENTTTVNISASDAKSDLDITAQGEDNKVDVTDSKQKTENVPNPTVPKTEEKNHLSGQEIVKQGKDKETQADLDSKGEDPKENEIPNGESDSNVSEPTMPSIFPDKSEDFEPQPELKDPEQYNDSENDGDYAKREYDTAFNPALKKESNVKNTLNEGPSHFPSGSNMQISNENFLGHESDINRNFLPARNYLPDQEDSHFFFYFLTIVLVLMAGYLIFHNKQKIIALIVEGRHERRRRSHGAGYKKLETK